MAKAVAIITANIGDFEPPRSPMLQMAESVEIIDYKVVTDKHLPLRKKSLSSRLLAKIPKMFGWEMYPGYDAYIWLDASLWLSQADGVQWFLKQLGEADIAVFRHPSRTSASAEADYLEANMGRGPNQAYLRARYEGEDLRGQMRAIAFASGFVDDRLYAGGAFCYRPTPQLQAAMRGWWYHTTRFHCIDQLSFPLALWEARCRVSVIDENIFHASRVSRIRRTDPEAKPS